MMFDDDLTALIDRTRRQTLGDVLRIAAARVPHKTALVYREVRQTYAELDASVNRTANALAARGVVKGDRIAVLSHNNHAFVVLFLALARLGAISVQINFMLNADEVAYILEHAEASGVIVEDALHPVAQEAIARNRVGPALRLRGIIPEHGGAAPEGWEMVDAWMAHADATPPDVDVADSDPIQLIYTSGTESRPKGAIMTSRNLIAQYVSCIVDGGMSADDVEIHALPLYHVAQMHCFLMPGLYLGASNHILAGADPTTILATLETERATKLFCPPTVWIALLRHPQFERYDLSSLRKGYYGAAIMPVEILRELGERLPQVALFNFYGQTEMSAVATVLAPQDQIRKAGSAGKPVINVQTMLVDDADRPVPPGVIGEIVHRGPQVMLGYWNDSGKTAEVFRNGWFHSGDLGVMDEDGYLTVVDRKKDMIKTGGENVASREVEEVLYRHPAIAEAAVFGIPHPHWIEAVIAAVILRPGNTLSENELIAFCRERLANFKTPKHVVVVGQLPKNASGKVLKRALRDTYVALAAPV